MSWGGCKSAPSSSSPRCVSGFLSLKQQARGREPAAAAGASERHPYSSPSPLSFASTVRPCDDDHTSSGHYQALHAPRGDCKGRLSCLCAPGCALQRRLDGSELPSGLMLRCCSQEMNLVSLAPLAIWHNPIQPFPYEAFFRNKHRAVQVHPVHGIAGSFFCGGGNRGVKSAFHVRARSRA